MFKVTNTQKDSRKFVDSYTGKEITLGPNKSVEVVKPIDGGSVFKVEQIEEKKITKTEVKQNDSSSS